MARRDGGSGFLVRRSGRGWWGFAGLLVLGLTPARADDPAAARWVAADAMAYVEIVRPERLIERATSPEVRDLLEAVPGLHEQLERKEIQQLAGVAQFVAAALGTTVEKGLRDLTAGGIVLAVEGENQPERLILILEARNPGFLQQAHDKLVELARADAKSKGQPDPIQSAEHRGVTSYQLNPKVAHAILDGCLVVTNGSDALKAVIDRARSEDAFHSITEEATWKSRRSALDDDAVVFAFARLDTFRKIDPKRFAPEKPNPGAVFLLGPWYESLLKAPWISASISLAADRLAAELVLPPPSGGHDVAYKTFLPGQGQGASPLLQPEGTILSVSLWRDLSAVWDVRDQLLPPEALQGLAQLDSFAGQFFGGRDFGTGVLGALRSEWRLVIVNQNYQAMDPEPNVKLPGFALIVGLDPEDREFAVRLQAAFQSFVGLVNIGAAQQKAPPLMLGSEQFRGVTISSGTYLPMKDATQAPADAPKDSSGPAKNGETVGQRFNFSPSAAEVNHTFILSSNVALARSLVQAIQEQGDAPASDATLMAEADGSALASLVAINREHLAMQNMLEKGNARTSAESEIDLLARLLRYLGHGRLTVHDHSDATRLTVEFRLGGALN